MNIKFKEEKGKQNIFIQTNKKQEPSFNTYLMLTNNIFKEIIFATPSVFIYLVLAIRI